MYESGWGKKLTYVVSYCRYGVVDSTRRYTRSWRNVVERRVQQTKVPDSIFFLTVQWLDRQQRRGLGRVAPGSYQDRWVIARAEQEKRELATGIMREERLEELYGRQSGSLEWRISRGEIGDTASQTQKSSEFSEQKDQVDLHSSTVDHTPNLKPKSEFSDLYEKFSGLQSEWSLVTISDHTCSENQNLNHCVKAVAGYGIRDAHIFLVLENGNICIVNVDDGLQSKILRVNSSQLPREASFTEPEPRFEFVSSVVVMRCGGVPDSLLALAPSTREQNATNAQLSLFLVSFVDQHNSPTDPLRASFVLWKYVLDVDIGYNVLTQPRQSAPSCPKICLINSQTKHILEASVRIDNVHTELCVTLGVWSSPQENIYSSVLKCWASVDMSTDSNSSIIGLSESGLLVCPSTSLSSADIFQTIGIDSSTSSMSLPLSVSIQHSSIIECSIMTNDWMCTIRANRHTKNVDIATPFAIFSHVETDFSKYPTLYCAHVWGDPNNGRRVDLHVVDYKEEKSQLWEYDCSDGRLRLSSDPTYCLHK